MKKPYILVAVLAVVVLGLAVLSYTKYEHRTRGLTLKQAVAQRDSALYDLSVQKQLVAVNTKAVANLKVSNTSLTQTNATLCAQIKAAKLVQPLCK